jgi:CRISPR-associated protein Cas5t
MIMLRLHVRAPFAALRTFTAGAYRPTAPFITPSAAYGLLLNVAGIESRRDDGESPMTVTRRGLPPARIALGAIRLPEVQTLYQQLHNYPVGTTGKDRAAETKGNKYNIQPIRRELLTEIDGYICLEADTALEERVRRGLREGARFAPEGVRRYGLPFLGDNNLLLSHLAEESTPAPAYWFRRLERENAAGATNVVRLTVWIDRRDMARTVSGLYSREDDPRVEIPPDAWTTIVPPKEE